MIEIQTLSWIVIHPETFNSTVLIGYSIANNKVSRMGPYWMVIVSLIFYKAFRTMILTLGVWVLLIWIFRLKRQTAKRAAISVAVILIALESARLIYAIGTAMLI